MSGALYREQTARLSDELYEAQEELDAMKHRHDHMKSELTKALEENLALRQECHRLNDLLGK